MALDRQSIEKKDFPIGRRGYDPDAVDAHLKLLADEIDELKRPARRRSESLAAAASEQVRSILDTNSLLTTVARKISESLHVERIAVLLRDGGCAGKQDRGCDKGCKRGCTHVGLRAERDDVRQDAGNVGGIMDRPAAPAQFVV